ncbi:hypothetical protein [Paenibacillus soyae]|uniref:Uncharacterized protein n=1 Tax=Paenibacillus soyae TaxID=2969249 RepID=A0A9X2ML87_9BACL|nr:hypothetical protein [Paenibacillus soyae]MCR2804043.1 hypothetical protein [Paenibacillus soyae]
MTCEYNVQLCFARPMGWGGGELAEEAEALLRWLFAGATLDVERMEPEEGLDIVVARLNGLATWSTELQLLDWMDERMPEDWWIWIAGCKAEVIPKEDAGPCRIKKRRMA